MQTNNADKRYFQGLSSPAAAGVLVGMVWVCDQAGAIGPNWALSLSIVTIAVSTLMVSKVRYHSFKDFDPKNKVPFVAVIFVVLLFVVVTINPPWVVFTVFSLYALSGPVLTLWHLRHKRKLRKAKAK